MFGCLSACFGRRDQPEDRAHDYQTGAAANERLVREDKAPTNPGWDVVFRKYSRIGDFDPRREDRELSSFATERRTWNAQREKFKDNEAIGGISWSRHPPFATDVLTAGNRKVVAIAALPPGYGVDLEAAYLAEFQKEQEGRDADARDLPEEYFHHGHDKREMRADLRPEVKHSKLSREVTVRRTPIGCLYGWIERVLVDSPHEERHWAIRLHLNPYATFLENSGISDDDRDAVLRKIDQFLREDVVRAVNRGIEHGRPDLPVRTFGFPSSVRFEAWAPREAEAEAEHPRPDNLPAAHPDSPPP